MTDAGSTVVGQLATNAATGEVVGELDDGPGHAARSTPARTVTIGDEVVTARNRARRRAPVAYPKGLLLGQVIDVRRDANEVVQTAYLQPAADWTSSNMSWSSPTTQGGLPPIEQQPVNCAAPSGRSRRANNRAGPHADRHSVGRRASTAPDRRLLPFAAMKGIVLAGGTATRLYPLTIVTNKHLLPIYDRPMIYYPIETLAGMGICEVMVVVGGKSVGDVVELLADGSSFGLDLTYRYQPGRRDRPCASGWPATSSGRRILLRARRQHPARPVTGERGRRVRVRAVRSRDVAPSRSRTLSVSGWPSSTPKDGSWPSRKSPRIPKSDLIPIGVYFLRPDAFGVIESWRRRCAASSRSPTS